MATFTVSIVRVSRRSMTGGALPVRNSVPKSVATEITSSGTSQQADITATAADACVSLWEILVEGNNVWTKSGANPTAAVGDDTKILDGERIYLRIKVAGEKLAVIDA